MNIKNQATGEQSEVTDSHPTTDNVEFIITGFGPFRNSLDNPTSTLTREIKTYCAQRLQNNNTEGDSMDNRMRIKIRETFIIETAASSSRNEVDALFKRITTDPDVSKGDSLKETRPIIVVLHLGVNYRGFNFQLEKCAYNDATFRIPDEKGQQPRGEKIVPSADFGAILNTKLDVGGLVSMLNATSSSQEESTAKAVVSDDPGRFVCNYTYFYSLDHCQQRETFVATDDKKCGLVRCLFLHVPPFEVVGKDQQLDFLFRLLQNIQYQIMYEAAHSVTQ